MRATVITRPAAVARRPETVAKVIGNLPAGGHSITASYAGDGSFNGSLSSSLLLVGGPAAATSQPQTPVVPPPIENYPTTPASGQGQTAYRVVADAADVIFASPAEVQWMINVDPLDML